MCCHADTKLRRETHAMLDVPSCRPPLFGLAWESLRQGRATVRHGLLLLRSPTSVSTADEWSSYTARSPQLQAVDWVMVML